MTAGAISSGAAARRERVRAAVILLAVASLYVAAGRRLVELQVGERHARAAAVERATARKVWQAPPRGRIRDRAGRVLAEDLPVFEARAEIQLVTAGGATGADKIVDQSRALADDLAACLLAADAATTAERITCAQVLRARILDAVAHARARTPVHQSGAPLKVDFLVADDIRTSAVVEALSALELGPRWKSLHIHRTTRYERIYPGGDACLGPVGFVADRDCDSELRTRLEALDGLRGGAPGTRALVVGPKRQRYWAGEGSAPQPASSVITTLDLDLQRAAHAELSAAVAEARADRGAVPSWGALVLCEVATGNVLAMASFVDGSHPRAAAFTPLQRQFEPGSVVKPLLFAIALRHGVLDWHGDVFDCTEGAPGRGWLVRPLAEDVPRGSRRIYDDHACARLSPAEVLVQSSNVGAVKVGLRTGVAGIEEYARFYRYGQPTGLNLAGEARGRCRTDLGSLTKKGFWYYTGPSYCFGYEMMVTPVQMLRAYLFLLARQPRELRLVAAGEVDGARIDFPLPPASAEFLLTPDQLDLLKAAMTQVVSDTEGATGRHVAKMLDELGVAPGVIAGKTGTSVNKATQVRTASFAGFAPVAAPRYLAFCVLQKDRAEGFYGGRYAAPAATRLLLHALGVLTPNDAAARAAARAQQVRAAAPVRRTVASAESMTGR
jgi:cell division protein FtsI (penicillin-binding protein 3)